MRVSRGHKVQITCISLRDQCWACACSGYGYKWRHHKIRLHWLPFSPERSYEPLNGCPFGCVFPSCVADLMQKERMWLTARDRPSEFSDGFIATYNRYFLPQGIVVPWEKGNIIFFVRCLMYRVARNHMYTPDSPVRDLQIYEVEITWNLRAADIH